MIRKYGVLRLIRSCALWSSSCTNHHPDDLFIWLSGAVLYGFDPIIRDKLAVVGLFGRPNTEERVTAVHYHLGAFATIAERIAKTGQRFPSTGRWRGFSTFSPNRHPHFRSSNCQPYLRASPSFSTHPEGGHGLRFVIPRCRWYQLAGYARQMTATCTRHNELRVSPQLETTAIAVGSGAVEIAPSPDKVAEAGQQVMDRAVEKAKSLGCTHYRCVISNGDPAEEILKELKAADADLVVMGRRGLGRVSSFLLGSVSQKVSHNAQCTCMTVC